MNDVDDLTSEADWYGPDAATFGDRVAAARDAAGMSQAVLARRLGIRLATLRGWENDTSEPRANRLSMLAGLLNVSMMWLINGDGEGLDGSEDAGVLSGDAADLLAEMRGLRVELTQSAKKVARLEKRLRSMLTETPNV
ncbi:transcriptional regulator [Sulfitobacter donghicola]|uniref:XRE family transcriptional regulator n=1 Tax=Sulfitobacter donghicola DSW-25 = KCTC 12864 = JCM 14565 TaxID=1300350 RepID=A0A073IHY3_9RHOB|nr:transcriptional regulator [Sulfitobacter donghicola]KEJ89948.1 XRE family transcriptional regulator [Sulfitobacter donghicola DSW-25 = KCTC 12864 = JCM 14565]KIN66926.1 Helix-turn-helix domain protein [Sulfitobacter donghicola DSW-25 = KCTC 12864 = JCM 14565]